MTGIPHPARLAALVAQLDDDQEGVRHVALERIREHLTRHGLKFVDLAAIVAAPAPGPRSETPRSARQATKEEREEAAFRERKRRLRESASAGPHLHEPVERAGFLSSRTKSGKRIVAAQPAAGSVGRLRIIRERDTYGLMTLTLSLETEFEVFQPYEEKCMRNDAMHDQLVTVSRTGQPLRY